MRAIVLLVAAIHIRHKFHGPPIDYLGLAAAAAASWVGLPGPGESVLVAAGIIAAHHKLDIVSVLVVAWVAALAGGLVGWAIGFRAGRAILTASGPLHRARLRVVARGDRIFERWPVLAIWFTPTWISGIHRVRASRYLPINAVVTAIWASGFGLGAYFVGPPVVGFFDDLDVIVLIALGVVIVAVLASEFGWRRRRPGRRESPYS
jgi:membrane protein DedA with SNARE-associated domain